MEFIYITSEIHVRVFVGRGLIRLLNSSLMERILLILFHVMIRIRGMLITIFVIISKIGLKMQYELGASIERIQWK